jgi:hypothetical protein
MKQFRALVMSGVFFTASFFTESSSAQMQNPVLTDSAINSVEFIGIQDDMLVFELHLENVLQKGMILSILDENGTLLFSEKIEKTNFARRYKIPKTFNKIRFDVRGKQQIMNESFDIIYKVEEKFEVSKAL